MAKIRYCTKCNKIVSKNCKTGICNKCRNWSGVNNPFYGKHQNRETIEKSKIKLSKISKELWKNPEYRNKVVNNATGLKRDNKFKETQRKNAFVQFIDPTQRKSRSIKMKESWESGKIIPNIQNINHSKFEDEVFKEILKIEPDAKQFVTLHADGKYYFPDIYIKDLHLIIECYGDYYHANPSLYAADRIIEKSKKSAQYIWNFDKNRIQNLEAFEEHRVVVIWEKDYKENKAKFLTDIDRIINWDTEWFT